MIISEIKHHLMFVNLGSKDENGQMINIFSMDLTKKLFLNIKSLKMSFCAVRRQAVPSGELHFFSFILQDSLHGNT